MLREALGGSAGKSAFLDRHIELPLGGAAYWFLRTIGELAREAGRPAELIHLVVRIREDALERFGSVLGELIGELIGELLAARLLEEPTGLELRSG